MVPPLGIEPSSSVLQTGAMTTFAKAAIFGVKPGIEPCLTVSQTAVRTTTLATPLAGPERLELPTSSFEDWHSNPVS